MPFTESNLPNYVKNYTPTVQRQWRYVFNSTYNKVIVETKSVTEAEKRAFMAANSVLKKRFRNKDSMLKNTREDYFQHLVDSYLGNLVG